MIFAVERRPDDGLSIIHTSSCPRFLKRYDNLKKNREWYYPFQSYNDARDFIESLDDDTYIKNCLKCKPGQARLDIKVEGDVELSDCNHIEAYRLYSLYLSDIGAKIVDTDKESKLIAHLSSKKGVLALPFITEIMISLKQVENNVAAHIELKPGSQSEGAEDYIQSLAENEWQNITEQFKQYGSSGKRLNERVVLLDNIVAAFRNLREPRELIQRYSDSAHSEVGSGFRRASNRLFLISFLLIVGFYVLTFSGYINVVTDNILFLLFTYFPAVLLLVWVYSKDRYEKEPIVFILFCFAWGIFSGLIAAPLNSIFSPYFEVLGSRALVAPFVEEPVKAIGMYLLLSRRNLGKEFNSPLDGIIYGFATGIGFYAMENFQYFVYSGDASVLIIRSLLCWGHGTYTAIIGLWMGVAKGKRGFLVRSDIVPGLLVAMFLHFLWNGWGAWFPYMTVRLYLYQTGFHIQYIRRMINEALFDEPTRFSPRS